MRHSWPDSTHPPARGKGVSDWVTAVAADNGGALKEGKRVGEERGREWMEWAIGD